MGGKLSQGKLEGTAVTCPRHGSQFDLTDGRVVRWLKESGLVYSVAPDPVASSVFSDSVSPGVTIDLYHLRGWNGF